MTSPAKGLGGEHRGDLAMVAALAPLTAVVFAEAFRPDRVFYYRDIANYWYPQAEAFVRAVAEGSWPLWSPCFSFGQPMLADPSYQVAYPFRWLSLVLLPSTYFKLFVPFHCWLAGAGLYLFARASGLTRLPAFVGAAVWSLSGPFLSAASLYHIYTGAAWIGWALLAVARTLEARTVATALGLGAVLALQVAAGSGEILLMTAALGFGYAAFHAARERTAREAFSLGTLAAAAAYGALLSAVQWLPTLAYVGASPRVGFEPSQNLYWSLHPASLVDLVVPRLVTDLPWGGVTRTMLFEGREPLLGTLYLGLPTAGLVALALLNPRRPLVVWSGLFFLLLVLAALGKNTLFAFWLLETRLIALFRFPVKALVAAGLPWALLAAVGLETWLQPWDGRGRRRGLAVAALMGALAAGAWALDVRLKQGALAGFLDDARYSDAVSAAGRRLEVAGALAAGTGLLFFLRSRRAAPTAWQTAALVLITVSDLAAAARGANDLAPAEMLSVRPRMLDVIGPPLDHTRVHGVLDPPGSRIRERIRVPPGWKPKWSVALGTQEMAWGSLACRWGLDGSFDGDPSGLTPEPIPQLSSLAHYPPDPERGGRLLALGAVDYAIGLSPLRVAGVEPVASLPSVYVDPIRLYRVEHPLPRAYVVAGARLAPLPDALLVLLTPDFDLRTEVVLDAGGPAVSPEDFRGEARIVSRTSTRVVLEVEASHDAYAVLVESYVPGWRATVDGSPAPVRRANAAFRAVGVPAGRHRVEMWYLPPAVLWGAGSSALAALFGLVFVTRRGLRGRKP
jgi:Bacterial membrane protein YfhO